MAGVTGFGTKRSLPNETRNVNLCQNPNSLRCKAAENYAVGAKLAQVLFNSDALTAPPRDHNVEPTAGEGQTRERGVDNETGPDRYRTKSRDRER